MDGRVGSSAILPLHTLGSMSGNKMGPRSVEVRRMSLSAA